MKMLPSAALMRRLRSLFAISLLMVGVCGCDNDGPIVPPSCVVDDLFCNGVERIIDGVCVKIPADPCDDGVECTEDMCDEDADACTHVLTGDCATCKADDCTPDCSGKECGSDLCGGLCGTCGPGQGCASVVGVCQPADGLGTCVQPRPLQVIYGQENKQVLQGDSSTGLHELTPTCNSTSTAVEDIWAFTIDKPTGVDIRTHDYDTVLSIRTDCLDDSPAATVVCNDDSIPPNDYGSRVEAMLQPGTYYLIVDGFDSTEYGPYTLTATFVDGCVPQCDGKECGGVDLCGGDCGTCGEGFACGPDFRCRPFPCEPQCTNEDGSARECGDDGCLGTCGSCDADKLCVLATGTCQTFDICDHEAPACNPECGEGQFCGSDCVCHGTVDPLPDLLINVERLQNEILFDEIVVNESSCSVAEACVTGSGKRRLLRFSVEAVNQGMAELYIPQPDTRPDMFEYSPCHGHFHFSGFADYSLLDLSDSLVLQGHKQAFCMEDTAQYLVGPEIGCNKLYTCDYQGIQAGWSDLYGNSLDCQWLDITGVPPGDYKLKVILNPNKQFEEVTLTNNLAVIPVTIPPE